MGRKKGGVAECVTAYIAPIGEYPKNEKTVKHT